VGRKAVEFFKARKTQLYTDTFAIAEQLSVSDCFTLAKQLCKAYLDGQFDRVMIGYTNFVSVLSQAPVVTQLLPLEPDEKTAGSTEILYEPTGEEVLNAIVPEYLGGAIYGALCESRASEQAARRTAMDSATQNAEDMIADLSLKFNQARQAAITQEITEIVAGSGNG
jgi:F-type H+-transporting ATPase subunit gamma